MSAAMQESNVLKDLDSVASTAAKRMRGPGKKVRDALKAEYQRGFCAGVDSVDRGPEGLGMAIFYGVVSVLSFTLGAWIF
jgi:hypothetical protein